MSRGEVIMLAGEEARYWNTGVKIVVVEDHMLVCEMLVTTCRSVLPDAVVRGAHNGAAGVAAVRELQPDVVLLDLVLPDGDGLEFVPVLREAAPATRIVALTSNVDEFTLHRALRLQVHGFLDKNEQPVDTLRDAVLTVMDGRRFFSSTAQRLRQAMQSDPLGFTKVLTDREQEVLRLIGDGLSDEEVARKLNLSAGTARIHRSNIKSKLGVHGTPQLMRYALEKGFTRLRSASSPTSRPTSS